MKKILLAFLSVFLIIFSASAQISKGSILLGGNLSGYRQSTDYEGPTGSSEIKGLSIYPSLGFVVKDNMVFGVNAGYGYGKTSGNNSSNELKSRSYQAGIFLRRYLPLGKNFYLFGETGLNYTNSKIEQGQQVSEMQIQKLSGAALYLYPGITYAVGKRVHLEASIANLFSLNYQHSTNEYRGSSNTPYESNSFSFSTNASVSAPLSLGFRFVLGK